MKKLALVCLVAVILTCSLGAVAEDRITFRNLTWFSTQQEVNRALLADGARNTSNLGNSEFAWRISINNQGVVSLSECVDCGYSNYYEGMSVAGYEVVFLMVSYLYPLIDGQILKDTNLGEFYTGAYELSVPESSSEQEMYDDLTRKLSYLYGDYVTGEPDPSFSDGSLARIWTDSNGNRILLLMDNDTAALLYYAGKANARLDALQFSSADSLEGL